MVCTTIRPTKLCYADTNTWEGVAALVADYFNYEPLTKPMLHVSTVDFISTVKSCQAYEFAGDISSKAFLRIVSFTVR